MWYVWVFFKLTKNKHACSNTAGAATTTTNLKMPWVQIVFGGVKMRTCTDLGFDAFQFAGQLRGTQTQRAACRRRHHTGRRTNGTDRCGDDTDGRWDDANRRRRVDGRRWDAGGGHYTFVRSKGKWTMNYCGVAGVDGITGCVCVYLRIFRVSFYRGQRIGYMDKVIYTFRYIYI